MASFFLPSRRREGRGAQNNHPKSGAIQGSNTRMIRQRQLESQRRQANFDGAPVEIMREACESEIVPWIAQVMTQEGVSPVLDVLLVPDYAGTHSSMLYESSLLTQLQYVFPNWVVRMEKFTGPFEDDEGNSSCLEGNKFKGKSKEKQTLMIRSLKPILMVF